MAAQDFPVRVTKGTGKDKIVRTAHSVIALRQLETEGFKVEKVKTADDKPAQRQQGGQKTATKTDSK